MLNGHEHLAYSGDRERRRNDLEIANAKRDRLSDDLATMEGIAARHSGIPTINTNLQTSCAVMQREIDNLTRTINRHELSISAIDQILTPQAS